MFPILLPGLEPSIYSADESALRLDTPPPSSLFLFRPMGHTLSSTVVFLHYRHLHRYPGCLSALCCDIIRCRQPLFFESVRCRLVLKDQLERPAKRLHGHARGPYISRCPIDRFLVVVHADDAWSELGEDWAHRRHRDSDDAVAALQDALYPCFRYGDC